LFRRYVIGNPAFLLRAFRQKISGKAVKKNDLPHADKA
jgi:hypothetical protein